MKLDKLLKDILLPYHEAIKNCIVDELLEETIDIVLECIYKDINDGKIRLEGVLDKEQIYDKVIEYMNVKGGKK